MPPHMHPVHHLRMLLVLRRRMPQLLLRPTTHAMMAATVATQMEGYAMCQMMIHQAGHVAASLDTSVLLVAIVHTLGTTVS